MSGSVLLLASQSASPSIKVSQVVDLISLQYHINAAMMSKCLELVDSRPGSVSRLLLSVGRPSQPITTTPCESGTIRSKIHTMIVIPSNPASSLRYAPCASCGPGVRLPPLIYLLCHRLILLSMLSVAHRKHASVCEILN